MRKKENSNGNSLEDRRVLIAKALPSDALAIQKVFYHTWMETYPDKNTGITKSDIDDRFKFAFDGSTIRKRSERLRNPPPGEVVLVARIMGKVVGVCILGRYRHKNQLHAIYVLPRYQRLGIGTAF